MKKIVKQVILTSLISFSITACNSGAATTNSNSQGTGSSNAATVKGVNSEESSLAVESSVRSGQLGTRANSAAPAMGNGIIDYSVATDYYYGTKGTTLPNTSLIYDLKQNNVNNISYVFAEFGELRGNNFSNPTSNEKCLGYNSNGTFVVDNSSIIYYALPLDKSSPDYLPDVAGVLGGCVNGNDATSYYSNTAGIKHVIPLIEHDGDGGTFLTAILTSANGSTNNPTTIKELTAYADKVAEAINNDPNTYGAGFDLEPSINSQFKYDTTYEEAFFGEIASQLQNHNKYLFLFDAANSANDLYNKGQHNIVVMPALYDIASTQNAEYGPVAWGNDSTGQYEYDVNNFLKTQLAGNTAPSMFVLPASATDTLWEALQGYNMVATNKPFDVTQTTLNDPAQCDDTNAITPGTIENVVLGDLLCSSTGDCTSGQTLQNIKEFFSQQNCVNYKNNHVMTDYFNIAITALQNQVPQSANKQNYLGAILYTWRISSYNDIAGAAGYYTQAASAHALKTMLFPAEISPEIWSAYNSWTWGNNIVK